MFCNVHTGVISHHKVSPNITGLYCNVSFNTTHMTSAWESEFYDSLFFWLTSAWEKIITSHHQLRWCLTYFSGIEKDSKQRFQVGFQGQAQAAHNDIWITPRQRSILLMKPQKPFIPPFPLSFRHYEENIDDIPQTFLIHRLLNDNERCQECL